MGKLSRPSRSVSLPTQLDSLRKIVEALLDLCLPEGVLTKKREKVYPGRVVFQILFNAITGAVEPDPYMQKRSDKLPDLV